MIWHDPHARYPWASWPCGYYPLVRVPENTGKHPAETHENGEKWAVITTVSICFALGVAVIAAAVYAWLS